MVQSSILFHRVALGVEGAMAMVKPAAGSELLEGMAQAVVAVVITSQTPVAEVDAA